MSGHLNWRDIAESTWNDIETVEPIEQAMFAAQMATYEATLEVVEQLENLQSYLQMTAKD